MIGLFILWGKYAVLLTFEILIWTEADSESEYQFYEKVNNSNCFIPRGNNVFNDKY